MPNTIIISDDTLTKAIANWVLDADADMLAHISSIMFGGECIVSDLNLCYEFTPNDDYNGAFEKESSSND